MVHFQHWTGQALQRLLNSGGKKKKQLITLTLLTHCFVKIVFTILQPSLIIWDKCLDVVPASRSYRYLLLNASNNMATICL